MSYFLQPEQYIRQSTQNRTSIDPENLCTWGVDYLDYHFGGGIAPRSFNLLACESGHGKTTFVSNMAVQNSIKGKRVAFVRLEGDMGDFADTEKWKLIYPAIQKMYQNEILDHMPDYQEYRLNRIPGIEGIEKAAENQLLPMLKNIQLFDKTNYNNVNRNNIEEILSSLNGNTDLIIIDHLHYFEIVDERQQYREQMETVKIINEFVDKYGIPVVLVSHVRKRDSKSAKQLLKMEDIQGSSDIFKIAHTVIMMSPHYEAYNMESKLFPTLLYTPKSRYGAPKTRIGIKTFDGKSKRYLDGYDIAEHVNEKGEWKIVKRPKSTGEPKNSF
jgi:KaiC/GvpD/RAD55 family RecA-like ATPase